MYDNSRDIDIVVKLEECGRDLDLHLYSFLFFSYCFSCKIESQKMQSIASVVGATLTGKDTYPEWWRKIKSTFIYNDLWDGICEGTTIEKAVGKTITTDPEPPESEKEKAIWRTKDKKALAVITATVSEEVSQHILPAKSCFEALKD